MNKKGLNILFMDLENIMRPEHIFHPGKRSRFGGRQAGFCADLAYILVFGYKWLGQEAESIHLTKRQFKKNPLTDEPLLKPSLDIMEKADVVVTWYGSGHDVPFLNTRLAQQGLFLDPKIRHIDLFRVASKHLRLSSNSLNNTSKYFGVEQKTNISPKLWADCWAGNHDSLLEMASYCEQDCEVLSQVYNKMLGLGINLPHVGRHLDPNALLSCPSCGASDYTGKGRRVTRLKTYQRLICKNCGTSYKGEEL
jgi:hypothetical protein